MVDAPPKKNGSDTDGYLEVKKVRIVSGTTNNSSDKKAASRSSVTRSEILLVDMNGTGSPCSEKNGSMSLMEEESDVSPSSNMPTPTPASPQNGHGEIKTEHKIEPVSLKLIQRLSRQVGSLLQCCKLTDLF